MGDTLRLSGLGQFSTSPGGREERGEIPVLSPRVAGGVHSGVAAGGHEQNRAGDRSVGNDGARSRGLVSRGDALALLRPERRLVALAESGGTAELLRVFGAAGRSAIEELAQGDSVW